MLGQVTKDLVVEFLHWLEHERRFSAATGNVRMAALHSFFCYLQYRSPEHLAEWPRILAIPVKHTKNQETVDPLSVGCRHSTLLDTPNQSTRQGRRVLAWLSLLYDSGARVQENIDRTPSWSAPAMYRETDGDQPGSAIRRASGVDSVHPIPRPRDGPPNDACSAITTRRDRGFIHKD